MPDWPFFSARERSAGAGGLRRARRVLDDLDPRDNEEHDRLRRRSRAAAAHELRQAGAEIVTAGLDDDARIDLDFVLQELGRRMCNDVLVEAGPTLVGRILQLGLADEIIAYVAPVLLGPDARAMASLRWLLERLGEPTDDTAIERVFAGRDTVSVGRDLLRLAGPERFVVDKTPAYARTDEALARLAALRPIYVWLLRHPLGVAASMLERDERERAAKGKTPPEAKRRPWYRSRPPDSLPRSSRRMCATMSFNDQPGQEVSRDQSSGVSDESTSSSAARSSGNSGTASIGGSEFIPAPSVRDNR